MRAVRRFRRGLRLPEVDHSKSARPSCHEGSELSKSTAAPWRWRGGKSSSRGTHPPAARSRCTHPSVARGSRLAKSTAAPRRWRDGKISSRSTHPPPPRPRCTHPFVSEAQEGKAPVKVAGALGRGFAGRWGCLHEGAGRRSPPMRRGGVAM